MSEAVSGKIFPGKLDLIPCSDFVATLTKRGTRFLSLEGKVQATGPSREADRCQYPSQSLRLKQIGPKSRINFYISLEFLESLEFHHRTDDENWFLTFFCTFIGLS